MLASLAGPTAAFSTVRQTDVVLIEAAALPGFDGLPIEQVAVLSCAAATCAAIPFQIDERDAEGNWALEHGPSPTFDETPGVIDGNDVLLFMAADAGEQAAPGALPSSWPAASISTVDPLDGTERWVYVVAYPRQAPRAATRYVQYDPQRDRIRGARVALGFSGGIPDYLGIVRGGGAGEVNLLDRFKVRASATFMFGLIHFRRDESDLTTEFVAWREGPIRVIRSQRQWVRLGWGIRSPTFGSYTYFYRDFAQLPVGLRLNFPPTYFFGDIVIRVILDFRDLRGWQVVVPGIPSPLPVDGTMAAEKAMLNDLSEGWFALRGPEVTLVQSMELGPTLATVRQRLLYVEDGAHAEPPEAEPGAQPGIGYRLDQWERVGSGSHLLTAVSYALPPDLDPSQFVAASRSPLRVSITGLPQDEKR